MRAVNPIGDQHRNATPPASSASSRKHLITSERENDAHSAGDIDGGKKRSVRKRRSTAARSDMTQRHIYEYVLGVVNPTSGECGAARHVLRSMRAVLGPERVVVLDGPLFADPAPLREAIRHCAVCFHREEDGSDHDDHHATPEATIDGGVGGVSENSNGVTRNEKSSDGKSERRGPRGTIIVAGGDGTVAFVAGQLDVVRAMLAREDGVTCSQGGEKGGTRNGNFGDVPKRPFILPAVAVLALGTGNDFSNSLGFGLGYSQSMAERLCCGGCAKDSVEPIIKRIVSAPAVPFDRWTARLVPLTAIWEHTQEGAHERKTRPRSSSATHAGDAAELDAADLGLLDWNRLSASGECMRYNFMNYFSIGYDAYVLEQFDKFRKNHPRICSTRCKNKIVYGFCGLKGMVRCSKLRSCIPTICLPQSAQCGPSTSNALRPQQKRKQRQQQPLVVNDGRSVTTLTLPPECKALLMSNVDSYAGGTCPWKRSNDSLFRREGGADPVAFTPVKVNDRKLEVQALGGIFHMALLRMGIGRSVVKVAQTRELYVFILCTPADIFGGRRSVNGGGGKTAAGNVTGGPPTPLCMQADGEPIGRVERPSVLYITELDQPQMYARCCNPDIVCSFFGDEGKKKRN